MKGEDTVRTTGNIVHVGRFHRTVLGRLVHNILHRLPVRRFKRHDGKVGDETRAVGIDLDLVLLLSDLLVTEQITDGFVVYFQEGNSHLILPSLGLELRLVFADTLNRPGNDTTHIAKATALHGVGLTTTGLWGSKGSNER